MSCEVYVNCGLGAEIDSDKVTVERIHDLLALAPDYAGWAERKLQERGITEPTVEDYEALDNICGGLAPLLCDVIYEAENIEMTPCNDEDGNSYVLYSRQYPWELMMNPNGERYLEKDDVEGLLKRYFRILTGEDVEIAEQEVVRFG